MANMPMVKALTAGPKPYFVPMQIGNTSTLIPKEDFYFLGSTNKYIVRIDSISVVTTRSPFSDTDTIALAVRADNGEPVGNTIFLGDLSKGTHPVNIYVGPLEVNQRLEFAYLVVNRVDPNEAGIQNTAIRLGEVAAASLSGATLGVSLIYTALHQFVGGWFPGGCDGGVASGNVALDADRLDVLTGMGGTYGQTDPQYGYDSPVGCGRNSYYEVQWTVTRAQ
jgi:hypothetical protein